MGVKRGVGAFLLLHTAHNTQRHIPFKIKINIDIPDGKVIINAPLWVVELQIHGLKGALCFRGGTRCHRYGPERPGGDGGGL